MAPRTEALPISFLEAHWDGDDYIRFDVFGTEICPILKKHKVSFRDEVISDTDIYDIKLIPSIKPFLILMRVLDDCLYDDPCHDIKEKTTKKSILSRQESGDVTPLGVKTFQNISVPPIEASPSAKKNHQRSIPSSAMCPLTTKRLSMPTFENFEIERSMPTFENFEIELETPTKDPSPRMTPTSFPPLKYSGSMPVW
eukprot:GHVL01004813.1.p1 GENE.GHVL01004813.1~~GHVL01004813.1.p1  ORF type:complete len:198 (+),score=58.63 GHVL01004813.1:219-812(+)